MLPLAFQLANCLIVIAGSDLLQPVGYERGLEGGFLPVRVRPLQSGDEGAVVPPLQLPSSARSWAERPPPGKIGLLELGTQPYRARDEATAILEQPQATQQVPRLELLASGGGGLAAEAAKLPGEDMLLARVPGARTAEMTQTPLETDEEPVPVSPITVSYRQKLHEEHRPPGAHIPPSLTDELDVVARTVVRPPPTTSSTTTSIGAPAPQVAPGVATSPAPTYIGMQTLSPTKPARSSRPPLYQQSPRQQSLRATGASPSLPPASAPANGGGDSSDLVASILTGLQQLGAASTSPHRATNTTMQSTSSQSQAPSSSQTTNPYATPKSSRPRTRTSPRTGPANDAGAGAPPPVLPEGGSTNVRQAWH